MSKYHDKEDAHQDALIECLDDITYQPMDKQTEKKVNFRSKKRFLNNLGRMERREKLIEKNKWKIFRSQKVNLDDRLSKEECLEVIKTAILNLSKPYREVITKYFLEEKNMIQICEEIGIQKDAAQKRLNRAIKQLREIEYLKNYFLN